MVGKAIYSRLTAAQTGDDAAATAALAVLAGLVGTRVYPGLSPENAYPMIVYDVHQEKEESLAPMTAREFTVAVTIVSAASYSQAQTLKAAVRTLLDRRGSGAGTWPASGGVAVKCFFNGSDESQESDGSNPEAIYYEVQDEYKVWAAT